MVACDVKVLDALEGQRIDEAREQRDEEPQCDGGNEYLHFEDEKKPPAQSE